MSEKTYFLANPYIEGSLKNLIVAENSQVAALKAYERISKYFNNSINNFHFTLLKLKSSDVKNISKLSLEKYGGGSKLSSNNFSHFIVNEKLGKNGEVSYEITKYNNNVNNLDKLISTIKYIQNNYKNHQNGGDSESEVSEDASDSVQNGGFKNKFIPNKKFVTYDNNLKGGKHKSDDSSSSSSSSSSSTFKSKFKVKKSYVIDPISYWYYYPGLYTIDTVYLPTFVSPLSFPYVVDLSPKTAKLILPF